MDDLLNCPFCGHEPRYMKRKKYRAGHGVGCSNLDCILWLPADVRMSKLHHYISVYVNYDDMASAWNLRYKKL